MAVVAIIGILVGIVTAGVGASMKASRISRAETMRTVLEQGIATFYAQTGEWPQAIKNKIDGGGDDDDSDIGDVITFTDGKQDDIFQEVVGRCYGRGGAKSAMLDVSSLFVCNTSVAGNSNATGCNFTDAVLKGSKNSIPLSSMAFGYAEANKGKFRRFTVSYNIHTDSVSVGPTKYAE